MTEDIFRKVWKSQTKETINKVADIKLAASDLLKLLDGVEDSFAISQVRVNLQQAVFWATYSVTE